MASALDVVFCGLNPPPDVAAGGHSFASASNRFWQALYLSGFTPRRLDPSEERSLLEYGCGITAVVHRPTRRGADVPLREFKAARPDLEATVRRYRPRAIAFLGKRGIAAMLDAPEIRWGLQPSPFAGAIAWVLPNPSGLNRAFSLDALVSAFSELRTTILIDRGQTR
nr:G/U mismatch-specific DNA glycosylase [Sphingomonas oligoaromativorans]